MTCPSTSDLARLRHLGQSASPRPYIDKAQSIETTDGHIVAELAWCDDHPGRRDTDCAFLAIAANLSPALADELDRLRDALERIAGTEPVNEWTMEPRAARIAREALGSRA